MFLMLANVKHIILRIREGNAKNAVVVAAVATTAAATATTLAVVHSFMYESCFA